MNRKHRADCNGDIGDCNCFEDSDAEGLGATAPWVKPVTVAMLRALRVGLAHPSNLVYAGRNAGHTVNASVIKALAARGLVELLPAKDGRSYQRRSIVARVTREGAEFSALSPQSIV